MTSRGRLSWLGPVAAAALLMPVAPSIAAAAGADDATEAALIAGQRQWVRRDGPRLIVGFPGFEPLVFEDRSCEELEGDDCVHYRLDSVFLGRDASQPPLFGIAEQYYEGGSYTLLAPNGEQIDVGARPLPSPDGTFLVAAASSDGHPPDSGITLLQRIDSDAVTIIRTIPTGALTNYDELRWIGPRCIGLRASVTDRWGAYGPQREFRLAQSAPEWTLTEGDAGCTEASSPSNAVD